MAKNSSQTNAVTHRTIIDAVSRQEYAPVYLLMGEEPYYVDRLAEYIPSKVLTAEESEFNLMTIYCTSDTDASTIINAARRYPMMSSHQVVLVKEAQNLRNFDDLYLYVQKPLASTVLILCFKNKVADRRKKAVQLISKVGVVYESAKLKDGMLPGFISDYVRRKRVNIEDQACQMLAEHVGSNLSRLASEIDKLCVSLPEGGRITRDIVERNIGISKEYNQWALRDAIVARDVMRCNRIVNYYNANPKEVAPQVVLSSLFNFFAQLMQAHYAPEKTEHGLMQHLGLRYPGQVRDIMTAMRAYSAMKTLLVISELRRADTRLKGLDRGANETDGDIMRELIFFILH